jgi:hypothetical protein
VSVALGFDLLDRLALSETVGASNRGRRIIVVHGFYSRISGALLRRHILRERDRGTQADRGSRQGPYAMLALERCIVGFLAEPMNISVHGGTLSAEYRCSGPATSNGNEEWDIFKGKTMTSSLLTPADFRDPAIVLSGTVDYEMYKEFRLRLAKASDKKLIVVELSTLGGDPEVARMMGEDVRYHSDLEPERHFVFLGKAAIYSAGTTFMSFFARDNRYLTRGTRLMIHERKLSKTLNIDGPLTTCVATVKAALHEIEASITIQNEGFENLVRESQVTMAQVLESAPFNWYIEANEAAALGLVRAVL